VAAWGAARHHREVTTAVYTGSFDPLHDGHMSIVEQAALHFDRVVVAVRQPPWRDDGE